MDTTYTIDSEAKLSAIEAENDRGVIPYVIPLYKERDWFPKNVMNLIFQKMKVQGLEKETIHGNPKITEEDFAEHMENSITHIFVDQANGKYAGMAWLTNVEESETIKKAEASVMFFKEYWIPQVTQAFGQIFLGQVFSILEFDVLYGITPKPNRLSRLYTTRLGFKQVATIPSFVSYHGRTVDAIVSVIRREEFNAQPDPRERVM